MSFSKLYDAVQADDGDRVSTKWLRKKAIEFSSITKIREQWSGVIESISLRGFYIEGPMGPPIPLAENEALIVLARSMCVGADGTHWRRFVLTKELMHVFDEPAEKTSGRDEFDKQIQRLRDPTIQTTPQYRAELKAFWRALAVLCTEKKRLEFKKLLTADEISWEVVGAALRIPVVHVRNMMGSDFDRNLQLLN